MSNTWENTLITTKYTILQALEIIDNEALRIAIVVDQNKKLLGIVTDGDIRRGILAGTSMNDYVSKVMMTNPTIATSEVSEEQLVKIMKSKGILSIPLVKNGIIVPRRSVREIAKIRPSPIAAPIEFL